MMKTNIKLALKVLNLMNEDFIELEASLLQVQDEATRNILFKEIQNYRKNTEELKQYYQRLLMRGMK